MRAYLAILLTAACGRVDFDAHDARGADDDSRRPDAKPCANASGHDEDLDAVDDACDVCPHVPDSAQSDSDGDQVGDACDPEPTNPRQQIALFASMRPGDQPFATEVNGGGTWTQLSDGVAYDGGSYGGFQAELTVANAVVAMGFTIAGETNGPDVQHQLAIYPEDDSGTFEEAGFNGTGTANVPDAAIAYWDGGTFASYVTMPTANGMHSGALTITGTYLVGTSVVLDAGWPSEPYHVDLVPFAGYQGGAHVRLDSNNVAFSVDWVCVIAW